MGTRDSSQLVRHFLVVHKCLLKNKFWELFANTMFASVYAALGVLSPLRILRTTVIESSLAASHSLHLCSVL